MICLKILLVLVLLFLAYEDFRYRALSMVPLAAFFVIALGYTIYNNGLKTALSFGLINIAIVTFQIGCAFMYLSWRTKSFKSIVDQYIGLGDLLFYFPFLLFFSPINFIWINTISLLIILVVYAIIRVFTSKIETIPLAGLLSMVLVCLLIATWILKETALFDDMYLADILYSIKQ